MAQAGGPLKVSRLQTRTNPVLTNPVLTNPALATPVLTNHVGVTQWYQMP